MTVICANQVSKMRLVLFKCGPIGMILGISICNEAVWVLVGHVSDQSAVFYVIDHFNDFAIISLKYQYKVIGFPGASITINLIS